MSTPSAPTVFIVDDDEDMRLSLQRLLKTVGLRAQLFATAQDFLQRNIPDAPSCLVLDVRLPGVGGLEVQHKLIEAGINIPIIFITAHGDIPMTVKAMKSGAVEFLTKPFRHQELLDAIQQALQRDQLSRRQRNEMAKLQERYKGLTARERKVMELVVSGMQTKQIASVLGTSEITAAVHRGRVMRKMQAGSPAELGSMAERLKLAAKQIGFGPTQ
jgi:FixJ family two-component response regulator